MSQYTKGEWEASYHYPYSVYATDGKRPPITTPIAQMIAPDQVEQEANAQLIASSPRMHQFITSLASSGNKEARELIETLVERKSTSQKQTDSEGQTGCENCKRLEEINRGLYEALKLAKRRIEYTSVRIDKEVVVLIEKLEEALSK